MAMTHFPQPQAQRRAPRVQLGHPAPASILLENGHRAKGNLQTVSLTGGLLRLAKALGNGDFVEVAFQTQSGTVHGMAEMLTPLPAATEGILQPFRFIAMADDDHRTVSTMVDSATDNSFLSLSAHKARSANVQ